MCGFTAPGSRSRVCLLLLATAVFLASPSLAQAQDQSGSTELEIPENYTRATHIIRPGDTFISITQEFLGSSRFWELYSQLNPDKVIRKLPPGARMNVVIDPDRVPLAARVTKRSGTVEAQPSPMSWLGAEPNDLLIEKDAARTKRNSSAELEFADGTSVVITEESLVFIRKLGRGLSTVESNRTTQQVELVEGQADLSSLAGSNALREDVEVVMGGSTLRLPKESPIRTRTALGDGGLSKVGVYEGDAKFDSTVGGTVELAKGEGLVAAANEAPKKERLLDAPPLTEPANDAELVASRLPSAAWGSPGAGAVSYTFEVCRDPECGNMVLRRTGLTARSHDLPNLQTGTYYWRATAASASGLDGYPSEPRSFRVVDLPADSIPPEVALRLVGFGVPFQGLQAFGPNPPLETSVSDEGTGVERAGFLINGREVALDAPLVSGRSQISLFAEDQAKQRSQTAPVEIFIDADAPTLTISRREAPVLERRTVERPRKKRKILRAKAKGATYPANSVFALSSDEPIAFSIDDVEWRPLSLLATGLLTDSTSLQLAVNDGYCLRAEGSQSDNGADGTCGRGFLAVNASDDHTGVKMLRAKAESGVLTIEARDEVGNTTELRYRIVPE